jgi:hypothetical protein
MDKRSKMWSAVYHNALAKGATEDQAERLADAVYRSWKRRRS